MVVISLYNSTLLLKEDSNGLNLTNIRIIVYDRPSWIKIWSQRWSSRSSKLPTKIVLRKKWKNLTRRRECLSSFLMLIFDPSKIAPYFALNASVSQRGILQLTNTRRATGRPKFAARTTEEMAFEASSDLFSLFQSAFMVFRVENNVNSK